MSTRGIHPPYQGLICRAGKTGRSQWCVQISNFYSEPGRITSNVGGINCGYWAQSPFCLYGFPNTPHYGGLLLFATQMCQREVKFSSTLKPWDNEGWWQGPVPKDSPPTFMDGDNRCAAYDVTWRDHGNDVTLPDQTGAEGLRAFWVPLMALPHVMPLVLGLGNTHPVYLCTRIIWSVSTKSNKTSSIFPQLQKYLAGLMAGSAPLLLAACGWSLLSKLFWHADAYFRLICIALAPSLHYLSLYGRQLNPRWTIDSCLYLGSQHIPLYSIWTPVSGE